jgi:hypothetical protein
MRFLCWSQALTIHWMISRLSDKWPVLINALSGSLKFKIAVRRGVSVACSGVGAD